MSQAPNESLADYKRKQELLKLREQRSLTMTELYELRDLTRSAVAHLHYAVHSKKEKS